MTRLRVATFNVHHCEGRDGKIDVERVARIITESGAGLVALQELDQGMKRTGSIDQPALLGELTGFRVIFAPTLGRGGGRYGVAIAADGDIEAHDIALPRLAGEEPRVALVGRWAGLTAICTHLSREPDTRVAQVEALASIAGNLDGPAVVMGDLNQSRRSLGPLFDAGFRAPPERHRTLAAKLRWLEADHILAGPGVTHIDTWTVPGDASDHLPLVADLELP